MTGGFVVPIVEKGGGMAFISVAGNCGRLAHVDRATLYVAAIGAFARMRALHPESADGEDCPALTDRERACLALAACGKNDWEIADELSLSEKTVSTYVQRVKAKYGVTTRVEAVVRGVKSGAISV
jgi:DNA-binding CsgD family transcriptional regulator